MNSSSFLSDNINLNTTPVVEKRTFISSNNSDKTKEINKSYQLIENKSKKQYEIKSATSKKWSIKFK